MAGNSNKAPFPEPADQPKQEGKGENEPKGFKAARSYSGAKATGSPASSSAKAIKGGQDNYRG